MSSNYHKTKRNERYARRGTSGSNDSHPTLDLKEYSGLYGDTLYGNAKVSIEGADLKIDFASTPQFNSTLKHLQNDTFTFQFPEFPSLPQGKVTFIINALGRVDEMRMNIPNPDFDFTELIFKKFE